MALLTISCLMLINLCQSVDAIPASDTLLRSEYSVLMKIGKRELTGICIVEKGEDGAVTGTLMNEFGVKAFDFTCQEGKTRIINVMRPLDKWYVRRRLRKDFDSILPVLGGEGCSFSRSFTSYVFTPLEN